jgi:TRAP-type C4-dicarboxylate transport system permease small subunit
VTDTATTPVRRGGNAAYWTLRALESGLLVASLVGIVMFAWSLVDILRIETTPASTDIPGTLWPGIFVFVGAMVLLQVVRAVLHRYRRDDGTPRNDARGAAATATAEMLAGVGEPDRTSDESESANGA